MKLPACVSNKLAVQQNTYKKHTKNYYKYKRFMKLKITENTIFDGNQGLVFFF